MCFPFGYKFTFKRFFAFQFEHVLCKFVVKGHVVFWGQLTHTGDPGSEANISQIPQVYELYELSLQLCEHLSYSNSQLVLVWFYLILNTHKANFLVFRSSLLDNFS